MKKSILLMALVLLSILGFKNAPEKTSNSIKNTYGLEKLIYPWELKRAPNYVTPKRAKFLSDTFTSGYWSAGDVVAESASGEYQLQFQPDGNLVLYDMFPYQRALWASGPMSSNASHIWFSSYGVTAAWDLNNNNIWTGDANTCSTYTASYYWVLQNDGNFVCYNTACSSSKSTRTHGGQTTLNWGTFQ